MAADLNIILLQVTRSAVSLTGVKSGRRPIFGPPQHFELPEDLRGDSAYSNLPLFAKFVKECMTAVQSRTKKIIFCLEDDNLVCKEYQHLPSKPKNLLSFARLEAETVLSDNIDDYLIQNYEYERQNEITGKLTSSLFAVKSQLILGLKKSFSQYGLHVIKIVPPVGGLLYAAKTAINSKNQTVAVLDMGFEKTRLLMLHDGLPVFQRTFEGIYEDIIEIVQKNKSVLLGDAVDLVGRWGVYGEDSPDPSSSATKQVATLLDASANELVRNIRMVTSSERLELNRIILCGAMSTLPNFNEFWNQLGLDVSLENIDLCAATGKLPEVSREARAAGLRPAAFFSASGLLAAKKADDIDFLKAVKAKSGAHTANVAVLALVTLLALGVMGLEPLLYSMKSAEVQRDRAALSSLDGTGIKELLQSQSELSAKISGAKNDLSMLPYGKSNTDEIVNQLFKQVAAKTKSAGSLVVDDATGSISLSFITSDYNDYLSIKHGIEANAFFTISIPFSVTFQPDGSCVCSVVLNASNFTPWTSANKDGGKK